VTRALEKQDAAIHNLQEVTATREGASLEASLTTTPALA